MTDLNNFFDLLSEHINESRETSLFDIFNAAGSIATAGTFIYLVIMDWRKSKRISDLERVALTLEKELHLKYQPYLWLNGLHTSSNDDVNFDLNNKGAWCRLLEYKISGDLVFESPNEPRPYELEQPFHSGIIQDTTRRWIFTKNRSGKAPKDLKAEIEITYEDRLSKKYSVIIKLEDLKHTLSKPIEIY